MAANNQELKGLSKYFNSTTLSGRANVAKATYLVIFLGYCYYKFPQFSNKFINCPPCCPQQDLPPKK